jgi:hypothetical protein
LECEQIVVNERERERERGEREPKAWRLAARVTLVEEISAL